MNSLCWKIICKNELNYFTIIVNLNYINFYKKLLNLFKNRILEIKIILLGLIISLLSNYYFSQTFTSQNSFSIEEHQPIQELMVPISVNGLTNSINESFGLEKICIDILHPEPNNLTIKLMAPDGTKVTLFQKINSDSPNLSSLCFDNLSPPIYLQSIFSFGTYRSQLPMGQVNNGQNPNGIWYLIIYDDVINQNIGTIQNVSLFFGTSPATPFNFNTSSLPIIVINTKDDPINNYVKKKVGIGIYNNSSGMNNWINDNPSEQLDAFIEWQGWSSPNNPKKNFDFDLIDCNGVKIDRSLLGLPPENDWILKAEFCDRTGIKNAFVFDLYRKMGHYAPRTRFCEVVLDGEYIGLYTLMEKIKRGENRVEIDKLSPSSINQIEISGGYIYEINPSGEAPDWYSNFAPINDTTTNYQVEYKMVYPKRETIPVNQLTYIKGITDSFELSLASNYFQDSQIGYRKYIDVYSFIDFMLINEFSANYDSYGRSTYLHKENINDGGKIKAGPPWDYDRTFGYDWPSPQGWVWEITNYYWPFPFWWSKLWTDEMYRKEVECRWKSYRNESLSNTKITQSFDSLNHEISEALNRNYFLWPNFDGISHLEYLDSVQSWINQRLNWMDQTLDQYPIILPEIAIINDTNICFGDTIYLPTLPNLNYDWDPGPSNINFSPDTTGEYFLTITDSIGCFSKKPIFIKILKPNADFNIIELTNNSNVFLMPIDSSNTSYSWLVNGDTISHLQKINYLFDKNGTYLFGLQVKDSFGCIYSEYQNHLVNTIFNNNQGYLVYPNPFNDGFWIVFQEKNIEKIYEIYDLVGNRVSTGKINHSQTFIPTDFSSGIYILSIDQKSTKIIRE